MVKEIIHIFKTYLISCQYFKRRWYKYIFSVILYLIVMVLFFNLTLFF